MKIRKELWFGFSLMALILAGIAVVLLRAETVTTGHYGLLMLALIVVAIMLGFPTAFTLMGMGMIFTWVEETYQYKQFNAKENKVVLRMNTAKTDMTKKGVKGIHAAEGNANIKDDSFPLVWYRTYGKGRVFYSEPGHNSSVWNHPKYQTMLANKRIQGRTLTQLNHESKCIQEDD